MRSVTFVTNVMGAFVDGWLLNSGIAEIASDELRFACSW